MPKKIGLSLSFCVREIAEGKVAIDDVHHLVTGCSPENEEHVKGILEQYSECYWRNCTEQALKVFNELHSTHRIMWCSTFQKNPPTFGQNVWLDFPD